MKYGKNAITVFLTLGIVMMMLMPVGIMVKGATGPSRIEAQPPSPVGYSAGGGDEVNTIVTQLDGNTGKDNFIYAYYPNDNYGGTNITYVGNWSGYPSNVLIHFPLPQIHGEIMEAHISLYATDLAINAGSLIVSAHMVTSSWSEGTGVYVLNPSPDDSNWVNRTTGTGWTNEGGDYDSTVLSYFNCSMKNVWYSLNITDAVKAWADGSSPNYGIILMGDADAYAAFASRENANPEIHPKLTITYGVEIDPPVPPIGTEQNTPVDVNLSGRGQGTVVHISGNEDAANLWPLYTNHQQGRFQALYYPSEVGAEGKIARIALDRSAMDTTNVSNFRIYMAHTDLSDLTTTFDNNYNGFLIEVFRANELLLNSSDSGSWLYFDLNGNFTYDSAHNLLVEIRWNGTGGNYIGTWNTNVGNTKRAYAWDDNAATALGTGAILPVMKFYVDVQKNAVLDRGTHYNFWPFCPSDESEMHMQMLWNSTTVGESGKISAIYFQTAGGPAQATLENLSIRMAHSINNSLGSNFELNHIGQWTEVLNRASYDMKTTGDTAWMPINLDRFFDYNGTDNIVIDIRWRGGSGDRIYLYVQYPASYAGRAFANPANYSGDVADHDDVVYNVRFAFTNSLALTWSATSSDTNLFTVSLSDNVMHITPVAGAHGKGTVSLTLHNRAYSTTQIIPVYVRGTVGIDPPLSAVTTNEDTPIDVDLSGRGYGTVVNTAGAQDASNMWPFYTQYQRGRYQVLYYPGDVGAEGMITRIAMNRSILVSAHVGDLQICMAHTDLTDLTMDFDNNYNGDLIEVFHAQKYVLGESDTDSWIYFELNWNFVYDSAHNLLVEIRWNGTDGVNVPVWNSYTGHNTRAYAWDNNANTALGVGAMAPVIKFYVDAEKNAAIDDALSGNAYVVPFSPDSYDPVHMETLWNSTEIGESAGFIDQIYFLRPTENYSVSGYPAGPHSVVLENLTIRMAHTRNSSLNTSFQNNHEDPWVEVFNRSTYTISVTERPEWYCIELDTPFYYNGNDGIVMDISRVGGNGKLLAAMIPRTDFRLLYTQDMSTDIGSLTQNGFAMRFGFVDSPDLTWSAMSSNTSLFTVSISDNAMHITPVENAYGTGNVNLTLSTGTYSTTQTIPVTINAVNDPPEISGLPSTLSCTEDIAYSLDMAPYISDVETDDANLTITTSSQYATVNGTVISFLYPEGITNENVSITVSDPEGLSNSTWINVSITPVNDPPYLENFVDNITVDATVPYEYTVRVSDEETPNNITISTDSQYATVSGATITFNYPKGLTSPQTVVISITDGEIYGTSNTVTYELTVNIIEHPEVTNVSVSGYSVTVSFDMPMNESTVNMSVGGLDGNITWNSDGTEVTFTSSTAIAGNYILTIPESAESTDGIPMLRAYSATVTFEYTQDDTDGDGMSDEWEGNNGLDPNDPSDGTGDNDNDGLSNLQEYTEGTNPNNNDTDDDGMPDNWEIGSGTDPTVNDANDDEDNDGLRNIDEYREGTDPLNADTDGDGMPDGDDANPLTPASSFSGNNMTMILILLLIVIMVMAALVMMKKRKGRTALRDGMQPEENENAPRTRTPEEPMLQQGMAQNTVEEPAQGTTEDIGDMLTEE